MRRLGEKISALRTERGLSAPQLAKSATVGRATLQRLEAGGNPHGDTLRLVLAALHRMGPLSERDVFEVARDSKLSPSALTYFLERSAPVRREVPSGADDVRARCHGMVDRMLARASPREVTAALEAMLAAFEASGPSSPMLTVSDPPYQREPGMIEQEHRHYTRAEDDDQESSQRRSG